MRRLVQVCSHSYKSQQKLNKDIQIGRRKPRDWKDSHKTVFNIVNNPARADLDNEAITAETLNICEMSTVTMAVTSQSFPKSFHWSKTKDHRWSVVSFCNLLNSPN